MENENDDDYFENSNLSEEEENAEIDEDETSLGVENVDVDVDNVDVIDDSDSIMNNMSDIDNEDSEDDDDDFQDLEEDDNVYENTNLNKNSTKKNNIQQMNAVDDISYDSDNDMNDEDYEDDDEETEYDNKYLQKFNDEINRNYIQEAHPECIAHNDEEITSLCNVIRDKNNNIIDDLHKTIPFLTKYEKARILGQRAKQIDTGASPFVKVPEHIIEGYLIAQLELEQKRIPFIIRRPIHGGGSEYWKLQDLELLT